MDSNHRRRSRQIYSLIPLATREPLREQAAYCRHLTIPCQLQGAEKALIFGWFRGNWGVKSKFRDNSWLRLISKLRIQSLNIGLPLRYGAGGFEPLHGSCRHCLEALCASRSIPSASLQSFPTLRSGYARNHPLYAK